MQIGIVSQLPVASHRHGHHLPQRSTFEISNRQPLFPPLLTAPKAVENVRIRFGVRSCVAEEDVASASVYSVSQFPPWSPLS